ncbi:MAG: tail fiber domain-containing protein [Chitinophagales bacterium]|nr:tail fiber domain-containing protein [Chitinophagales bacterium]
MKKLSITLLFFLFALLFVYAQPPKKLSYQAVIRDNNGQVISNQSIGLKVEISNGFVEYSIPISSGLQTNSVGLLSTDLDLSNQNIDWSQGPFTMKVLVSTQDDGNYDLITEKEISSVPYALFALDGNTGPKGDKGEKGDKGDAGTGITIKGSLASPNDLPSNGNDGDAYLIDGSLYVWAGTQWENVGNIQGPKGDKGDTGATGSQGIQGEKGEQGIAGQQGPKGDTGATGATGPQGIQGEKGEQGIAGQQGQKGDTGATGPQGIQGEKGEQGIAGQQGPKGDKGDTGATGSQGIQGEKGEQGVAGQQGSKGDKGDTGATGSQGIQGEKGEQGIAGQQGPKGDKGDAGATGSQGIQGEKGEQGIAGQQGPKGDKGDPGSYIAGTGITIANNTISANNTLPIWNANQLQSTSVSSTAPAIGQILEYNGQQWEPTDKENSSSFFQSDNNKITYSDPLDYGKSFLVNTSSVNYTGGGNQQAEYKLMFLPNKGGAFRVGSVGYTEWDENNIGNGSIALGNSSTSVGESAIAIGNYNQATEYGAVAIGTSNQATNIYAMALGFNSIASGDNSKSMGYGATASGSNSLATGYISEASGNNSTAMGSFTTASGISSTTLGAATLAAGENSIAMGRNSTTEVDNSLVYGSYITLDKNSNGSIILADASRTSSSTRIFTGTPNVFYGLFAGGYRFYSDANGTVGLGVAPGGNSWVSISDSTKKENFKAAPDVLNKIAQMKLGSWNYKGQDKSTFRHYGPMAQEFYHHFGNDGIGTIGNDTTIASADIDGVMMIAIQQLIQENNRLKTEVSALKSENSSLKASIESELSILKADIANLKVDISNSGIVEKE